MDIMFYTLHRKEVTLHAGSILKIRGHPRDLVQVDFVPGGFEIVNVWSGYGKRGECESSSSHNF